MYTHTQKKALKNNKTNEKSNIEIDAYLLATRSKRYSP